jgi:hypothetical protein
LNGERSNDGIPFIISRSAMSALPTATLRVASIPFAARRGEIDHNVAQVVARSGRRTYGSVSRCFPRHA